MDNLKNDRLKCCFKKEGHFWKPYQIVTFHYPASDWYTIDHCLSTRLHHTNRYPISKCSPFNSLKMCMCAYDLKDNWRSFVTMSAKGIISLSASWFSNENGPMMLVATNAVDFSHIFLVYFRGADFKNQNMFFFYRAN